jgi:ribosomal protein S7
MVIRRKFADRFNINTKKFFKKWRFSSKRSKFFNFKNFLILKKLKTTRVYFFKTLAFSKSPKFFSYRKKILKWLCLQNFWLKYKFVKYNIFKKKFNVRLKSKFLLNYTGTLALKIKKTLLKKNTSKSYKIIRYHFWRYLKLLLYKNLNFIRVEAYLKSFSWAKNKRILKRRFKKGYSKFGCFLYKKYHSLSFNYCLVPKRKLSKTTVSNLKRFVFSQKTKRLSKIRLIKVATVRGVKKNYIRFRIRHFKIINRMYSFCGFRRVLYDYVRFARFRRIISRAGKIFINKKTNLKFVVKGLSSLSYLSLVGNFLKFFILKGLLKKSLVLWSNLFILLKFKYKEFFLIKFFKTLENIRPLLSYRTMYVGGKKYRIPVLIKNTRGYRYSLRWILNHSSKNILNSVFTLIELSSNNEGPIVKYRKDYHLVAFEGKSYVRFLRFLKSGF